MNEPTEAYNNLKGELQPSRDLTGLVTKAGSSCIARGGHAEIWRGTWERKDGHTTVAVKVLRTPVDAAMSTRFFREAIVWSALRHPHIAQFLGISFGFIGPSPSLVSPYYRHGNIINYLKSHPNANKSALVSQSVSALSYLHSCYIVHGDIKGSNILINDGGEAIVSDFSCAYIMPRPGFITTTASATRAFKVPDTGNYGFAEDRVTAGRQTSLVLPQFVSESPHSTKLADIFTHLPDYKKLNTFLANVGGYPTNNVDKRANITPELLLSIFEGEVNPTTTEGWRWKAPEQMTEHLIPEGCYVPRVTMASDVWAFSMTVIEVITGSIPFSDIKSDARAIFYVMTGGRPRWDRRMAISDDIWAMLERCWSTEPKQRPSMATLHHFFSSRAIPVAAQRARL